MIRQAAGAGAVARANPVGSLEKNGKNGRLAQAQGPAAIPPQIRRPGCIGEDGIISNSRTTNRQTMWTKLNIFWGGVVAHEGNLSRK